MEINRRDLLVLAGRATCTAAISVALAGCSADDGATSDERLRAAVRSWVGAMPGAGRIAATSEMGPDAALRTLRLNASEAEIAAALAGVAELRAFVADRRVADLAAGRVRVVAGWRLAETEVAIATLAAD